MYTIQYTEVELDTGHCHALHNRVPNKLMYTYLCINILTFIIVLNNKNNMLLAQNITIRWNLMRRFTSVIIRVV